MRQERGWSCTAERDEEGNKKYDVFKMKLRDNKADGRVTLILFRTKEKMEQPFICPSNCFQRLKLNGKKQEKEGVNLMHILTCLNRKDV